MILPDFWLLVGIWNFNSHGYSMQFACKNLINFCKIGETSIVSFFLSILYVSLCLSKLSAAVNFYQIYILSNTIILSAWNFEWFVTTDPRSLQLLVHLGSTLWLDMNLVKSVPFIITKMMWNKQLVKNVVKEKKLKVWAITVQVLVSP